MMLKLGDGVICYSRSQETEINRLWPGVMTWTAANSCVTRAQCEPNPFPGSNACISYVGRLIESKKPMLLLEAFALAVLRLPAESKLLLVGSGSEQPGLASRVRELGLTDRVEMPGHVGDEAGLHGIYARSAVAVSPGYVGLSAIQCMAWGVPILVAKDEPHSPEIEACLPGKTADFFPSNDPMALADKLVEFCRPDSPWASRREAISTYIAQNYTFEGMVETFTRAIREVDPSHPRQNEIRAALVWAQYGPYHLARLRALKAEMGSEQVFGVEQASKTTTYAWSRETETTDEIAVLLPDHQAEKISALKLYRQACGYFRRNRINVVFVPSYWPASSLAIIYAARAAGARMIMMNESHEGTAKAKGPVKWMKKRLVLSFDAALLGGEPQCRYFASLGIAPNRIFTGYDVVDNKHFARMAASARVERESVRRRRGLPERYFLNVGRMVAKKNLDTLVEAYAQVLSRMGLGCPKLVLVGCGNQEASLVEKCRAHQLTVLIQPRNTTGGVTIEADVYFAGFRQIDELPDYYALAECFILPSKEEEWGLVVNEAMACGLPVIVSATAGCAPDLVEHGVNGYKFDPANATELAGRLEVIAADRDAASAMGRASQERIAEWGCDRFAQAAKAASAMVFEAPEGGCIRQAKMNWRRYWTGGLILWCIETSQRIRRRVNRKVLGLGAAILSLGLALMVGTSLVALRQVTASVKSIQGDSLLGVESAVSMRRAVREMQLDLLRHRREHTQGPGVAAVGAFSLEFRRHLASYRSGAFEAEDEQNAEEMERLYQQYLSRVSTLADHPQASLHDVESADASAQTLIAAISHGYDYSRIRVNSIAEEVGVSAKSALSIFGLLSWCIGLFLVAMLVVAFAYCWLTVSEEDAP